MKVIRFTALSLAIALLAMITQNGARGISKSIGQDSDQREAVANVVDKYMGMAHSGNFEDISSLTTVVPESAFRERAELSRSASPQSNGVPLKGAVKADPIPKGNGQKYLDIWVRKNFPKSIFDNHYRVGLVREILVKGEFAKVTLHLQRENEANYQLLPWVFMLTKDGKGKWTIYDIQTPSGALEYYP